MLRFAPSPNGFLHLGHALSLLANEQLAQVLDRPLTIRIEDIDTGRARPEFEAAIFEDTAWLGVALTPPFRRQSAHFAQYLGMVGQLREAGLVYPSFATRREIAGAVPCGGPRDPDGAPLFPGDAAVLGEKEADRRRASGEPAAWRLDMAEALKRIDSPVTMAMVDGEGGALGHKACDPAAWGDVVLARKDTPTSYHLAVVVDDAAQGISHVVRGEDLLAATAVHRVLQILLDLPAPAYFHHRLVPGDDGRKLSKSNGALSLRALREEGWSADRVRESLGYSLS
ncbi:MAG: tRNA glutamyl-Q(34) synthetase GluQRS [Pseudomonadota bacterium]